MACIGLEVEQTPDSKKSFFRYKFEKFTLDFLPQLKSFLRFRPSFSRKLIVAMDDIEIPFISYEDLVSEKNGECQIKGHH